MGSKLSCKDILQMIAEKGDSEGLDLSEYDLSDLVLTGLDLHGVVFGTDWRTPDLGTACLKGARLEKCNLRGAKFIHVDLSGVSFFSSDLQDAVLGVANCTDTSFRRANLRGVNFHGSRLNNTDFVEADLRDSDFHSAYIGDMNLTKAKVGDRLLFEDYVEYQAFLERHKVEQETITFCLATRFLLAEQTYLALKKVFLNQGEYEQASWAYIKERQMERMTHWPPSRAQSCYSDEWDGVARSGLKRQLHLLAFSVRHLYRYILDWIAEVTCGYGEHPLRTVWWALATISVFPVFYWLSAGVETVNGVPMGWIDYLNYSLGAFSTIGFSNFVTINSLAQTLTSIEALLGIAILALLMFTLGNRISRS